MCVKGLYCMGTALYANLFSSIFSFLVMIWICLVLWQMNKTDRRKKYRKILWKWHCIRVLVDTSVVHNDDLPSSPFLGLPDKCKTNVTCAQQDDATFKINAITLLGGFSGIIECSAKTKQCGCPAGSILDPQSPICVFKEEKCTRACMCNVNGVDKKINVRVLIMFQF